METTTTFLGIVFGKRFFQINVWSGPECRFTFILGGGFLHQPLRDLCHWFPGQWVPHFGRHVGDGHRDMREA